MRELNPGARALLDQVNRSPAPKIHELTVEEARLVYKKMNRRSVPPAEPVAAISDHPCPSPDGAIPIRLYVPAGKARSPAAAIAFVHGGGWVFGDLDDYDSFCCALANRSGCRVLSIGYRLAPEHKYPAALRDVEHALRWIVANAAALSLDASRLAVVADSAGANLALGVAQSAQPPLPIRTFALIYPATDFTFSHASQRELAEGHLLTRATLAWFLQHYLPDAITAAGPRVSPLFGPPIAGLKDALILTAGFDPLRDEGHAFAEKLRREGVDVAYECYDDMIHGFITMGAVFPAAEDALARVAGWVKGKLAPEA